MQKRPTFRERVSYFFDNFMSRGTAALIGGLGLLSLVVVFIAGAILSLGGLSLAPEGSQQPLSFFEAVWESLMRTFDAGTMGGDTGWGYRLVMLFVTIGGIFVVSTLIGVLTAGVEGKLEQLRKGDSRVLENNHTLILGWSAQIFTILSELMEANENQRNARIVILADRDKAEMDDEIRQRITVKGTTRIICRSGNPVDLTDLEIGSPGTTKSIIVLPPEINDPDSSVIKTVLALTNAPNRRSEPYHIVTQIRDLHNMEVIRMVGVRDRVQVILTGDLIARIIAQTSRQSGLSATYTELMDFGGDEIYFSTEPSLFGKTFGKALLAFEDSSLMGIQRADGTIMMNPPMETCINTGDRIFAISADDDTVLVHGMVTPPVDEEVICLPEQAYKPLPEKCLILGWNRYAPVIIRELDNYVVKGSRVTVVVDTEVSAGMQKVQATLNDCCGRLPNIKVTFQKGDTTDRSLLEGIKAADYDHVIVLSYAGLDIQEADAKTLVTLLHLRDISLRDSTPFSIVSEMLDLRNRELAEVAHVNDFIVSPHLVSLMMAQISENADLFAVFTDIFDPEGSEIYLKPVTDYVGTARPVNFYTVVEAARRRGHTAIGYRLVSEAEDASKGYGVHTNPGKSVMVTFTPEDKIIVLSEN
jgi:ion channel POLLUX/CASTOR